MGVDQTPEMLFKKIIDNGLSHMDVCYYSNTICHKHLELHNRSRYIFKIDQL